MSFEYLNVADAIARPGLRMVVVGNVPSSWGEAAKGIFHIKKIDWAAVRLVYDDESLNQWAGQLSAPVAIYNDEPPRSGWEEILALSERLSPTPPLLPPGETERALALTLAGKFCGQQGLGWHRRLQLIHAGLSQTGGFPGRVAGYLGGKYGYDPAQERESTARITQLLGEFAALLKTQEAAGKPYYFGSTLTAVDVYSAAFMALFRPLPEAQCAMNAGIRAAFEWRDVQTEAALDPILIAHRDMMYARHLELPLSL